jgi:hypothetical protein
MGLLQVAAAGAAGYVLYRFIKHEKALQDPVAFAPGEAGHGTAAQQVRNAGPESMRSDPPHWDHIDEASDESYPASDPPAANRFT